MVSGNYFGYEAGLYGASNIGLMGLPSVSTAAAVAAVTTSTGALSLSVGAGLDNSGKRERTKFNEKQVRILESVFHDCQYPQGVQRESLARELNLTETKVQVWFKNRRAKHRAHAKYEQLKLDVGANNKCFNTSTNGECNSSSDAGSLFSSTSNGSNEPAGSLTAPFAPNDGSLLLQKDGASALVAASTALGGSVGDTEDENEGSSSSTAGGKTGAFVVKSEPSSAPRLQFPSSMPMIPLPTTNALEDIKPFEKSFDSMSNGMPSNSVVNAAAAAAAIFPFSAASCASTINSSTFLPSYPSVYQNYNQSQLSTKSQSLTTFPANGFDLSSMANSFNPLAAAQGWMNPNYPSMLNMMNSFSSGAAPITQNGGVDFINNNGSTPALSAAPSSMISPSVAAAAAAAAMSGCYAAVATPPICGTAGTNTQMYDLYNSYYHPSSTSLWDTKLA